MKLLIDITMVNDPGLLSLQDDLINAIINVKDDKTEIIILKIINRTINIHSNKTTIIDVNPAKYGWLDKWLSLNIHIPRLIKRHKIDVYYSLNGLASKAIKNRCAILGTVNNMMPFSSFSHQYYSIFSIERIRLFLLKKLYIRSCQISSALVFHSIFAKDTIGPFVKDIDRRTTICYPGIPRLIKNSIIDDGSHPYNGKEYFFYLSAIYNYKNHINLIKGYKKALQNNNTLPDLVIAGYAVDKIYVQKIKDVIHECHLKNRVKYIGPISKYDKKAWLHFATANFFPSLCETNSVVFSEIIGSEGLMACSNIPPMSEIMGPAAILFDPFDDSSIAEKFILLTEDKSLQRKLLELSRKHSENFSWVNCGNKILKAVKFAYTSRLI